MMDLDTIKRLNAEAARAAEVDGAEPFVVTRENVGDMPPFPFPYLGDYTPPGWREVERYFVDSSGVGLPNEPALTAAQFHDSLKEGRGYGIVSVGQFQVYVAEFERIGTADVRVH